MKALSFLPLMIPKVEVRELSLNVLEKAANFQVGSIKVVIKVVTGGLNGISTVRKLFGSFFVTVCLWSISVMATGKEKGHVGVERHGDEDIQVAVSGRTFNVLSLFFSYRPTSRHKRI